MSDPRSLFQRDFSTRFHLRTQTQDKLQRANYFRHHMKDAGGNRDHFRWNLEAFLEAARSVTDIMHTEYSRKKSEGFEDWYQEKAKAMMADPVMYFLLKKRNEVVHAKVVDVRGRHRSEIAEELSPLTETVAVVVTRADGTVVENQYASTVATEPVASSQAVSASQFIWTFQEFPGRDVISVVEEILSKLERLVVECTQRFDMGS
jgi:hypothetical protein